MNRRLLPTAAALTLVTGSLCLHSTSRADDATASTSTTETVHTHTESSGPDMRVVGGGIFTFGVSYAVAVVVGATSTHQGDGDLYIPIVGPWMDFVDRGGCPQSGSCGAETGNKVLLVVDGVFQAIGVLSIASGLLFERTTVDTTTTSTQPSVRITPVEYAHGGLGLAAVGRF
jgi:hypothetical protein